MGTIDEILTSNNTTKVYLSKVPSFIIFPFFAEN